MAHEWNLDHNRLARGAKSLAKPQADKYIDRDPEGIRDFFLYALFARIANNDNSNHEFATKFIKDDNLIELEIDESTLQFLEKVAQGDKFKRYINWLVQDAGGTSTIVTDGETINGDGTDSDPIKIKAVITDDTLDGLGTTDDPLTVVGGSGATQTDNDTIEGSGSATDPIRLKLVYTDGTIDGSGTEDDPLSISGIEIEIFVDNETIEGNGDPTDPIRIKKVFTDDTINGSGTEDDPLSVPPVEITVDDETIEGNGTPTSPFIAPQNFSITQLDSEDIIIVPYKQQMVFGGTIDINGELVLDGSLFEVE